MRSKIAGLMAAALAVALVAAPAQGTVRDKSRVQESYSYPVDCGFPIEVTGSSDLMLILREGKNKDAGAFPVMNNFMFSERWTNADTGEWFTIRGHFTFIEEKASRVDGSIFEFRAHDAGQPYVVEDSGGNVVERNSGSVHVGYLFDTGGDNEPGGTYGADTYFRVAGPHPSLEIDSCQYAVELIG